MCPKWSEDRFANWRRRLPFLGDPKDINIATGDSARDDFKSSLRSCMEINQDSRHKDGVASKKMPRGFLQQDYFVGSLVGGEKILPCCLWNEKERGY